MTAAVTVQMATEKLVDARVEQLLFGYQRHCNDVLAYQPPGSYLNHLCDSKLMDDSVESSNADDKILYSLAYRK